ncbi:pentatricopeptide repeat-containing protein At1g06710, mitochondrial-like [Telopea speciosissima]|uniref:pentatricopeptide repeat-containing protein At1g06710, mitochondrial-like n=1 Tax=Telopea speciosissima TaxID=54955 RepID=UPI001CC6EEDC|nr:pentatricopeptide repeat-containing protein At1g06710, mitochondrial-like [Telopea speciosissima]
MKLRPFIVSKLANTNLSRSTRTWLSPSSSICRNANSFTNPIAPSVPPPNVHGFFSPICNPKLPKSFPFSVRYLHSIQGAQLEDLDSESESSEEEGLMNEFLSRFVWIMRGELSKVYPDCDKQTIDGMLLIIVEKVVSEMEKGDLEAMLGATAGTPSLDFSEDLWKTVWEVSNSVINDMNKEMKKEQMKWFLQSEEVKEMCRFAGEVGIRGDMLRELRFKWSREKMEEYEFYQNLDRIREEDRAQEEAEKESRKADDTGEGVLEDGSDVAEEKPKVVSLPQRRGKIKYTIYGLDLSDPMWSEVADRIHDAEKLITPEEPKPITGKCKFITEKILFLKEEDDPSSVLAEWVELLQPSRIDWVTLLHRLQECNINLYFKVAELVLNEESFQTNIRDYSKLIDAHAKENRMEDAERILNKMAEKGIQPDILTSMIMVHMYSKAGNLEHAKAAFESLRSRGFQPDAKAYHSMIMAYVNAGQPKLGESLMREMEARDIKPTKEIYMALLRSFAERGHVDGAQRIATTMQFAGFQPSLESCALLVEAYGQAGNPEQARSNFDYMMKLGHRPDDKCTASMIAAYEKKNMLDRALDLLLQLEKDGFEPGVATYTMMVDWFCKLQLVDEAEQLMDKIAEKGEAPRFKLHVGLCDMYARAGDEKKALQALRAVEAKKDLLGAEEFERVINGLLVGGLAEDARRVHQQMEAQGFAASEPLKVAIMASQAFRRQRPTTR